MLKGFTSNVRYAEKEEKEKLTAIQADLANIYERMATANSMQAIAASSVLIWKFVFLL
jgi:hypothetical protein